MIDKFLSITSRLCWILVSTFLLSFSFTVICSVISKGNNIAETIGLVSGLIIGLILGLLGDE